MFTTAQKAIIDTGKYSQAFNVKITNLKGGNSIYWTTLPFDYVDGAITYVAENFLLDITNLTTTSGAKDNPTDITIAGTTSMMAAFDKCLGAQIEIQIGIYSTLDTIYFNPVFYGTVTKYGIKRGISNVNVALEVKDKISSLEMTNSRILTKEDQLRRVTGDQCLRYMGESTTAIFWGKE